MEKPSPKTDVAAKVPADLKRRLARMAKREMTSESALVRRAITNLLKEEKA